MGLFDAYDPATYQPAQGGLLDRLLASVAAPTDQGPGFPALPQDAQASAPAAPAPQPQQASPIAVGGYQMPRVGPAAAFELPPGQLDPNTGEHVVQPAAPAAPVQQPALTVPGASGSPGFMTGYQNLHHGGGLIGSVVAAITGKRNDPQAEALQRQQTQLQQQYTALVNAGVPHQQALVAVLDPEAGKTILAQTFGPNTVQSLGEGWVYNPKTGKTERAYTPEQKDNFAVVQRGEDSMGNKKFVKMNKATGDEMPWTSPDANSGGGIGDMSLTGPAYLATVPKAQAGIMRGMVDGTIQPPSSFAASKPYWQAMLAGAKNLDPNFDENTWTARHKMTNDLASSGNSSMGGILSNGGSSFSHLAELSGSMSGLGNASHDFPGGGYVAYGQNAIGNALGGSDTKAKLKAINDNLGHYGQESTKFYSGTGGGAEERMNALKEMNPTSTSSEEMASYVEKEKSLMLDRLNNKFQQIRDTYGEEQGNRIIAKKLPDIQRNIATIDANIAKLRGGANGTAAALPAGWSVKVN
jgi:hypothetical protein